MWEALWAKKEEKDGVFFWLPLPVHLEDTKRITGLLWEHWLSDGQKAVVAKDFDTGKQIAMFTAGIHDIGKATPAFQLKKGFSNSKDLDNELTDKLIKAGLTDIDKLILAAPEKTPHGLAGEVILSILDERFCTDNDIGSIVGGHHGRPIDDIGKISEVKNHIRKIFFRVKMRTVIFIKNG